MKRGTSLETRALRAYFRRAASMGGAVNQPSSPDIHVDGAGVRHVVLTNTHGILGVYAHDAAEDRLRWVEPSAYRLASELHADALHALAQGKRA